MPQWHEWRTTYHDICSDIYDKRGFKRPSVEDYYYNAVMIESEAKVEQKIRQSSPTIYEYLWQRNHRPYYSVYPLAVDALTKIKLDAPADFTLPLPQLLIRFQKGFEPTLKDGKRLRSILAADAKNEMLTWKNGVQIPIIVKPRNGEAPAKSCLVIWADYGEVDQHGYSVQDYFRCRLGESSLEEAIERSSNIGLIDNSNNSEEIGLALRIVCSVSLLSDDPELITRDVLAKDADRYEKADEEQRKHLEERAVRNGKYGWVIGEKWETIPHVRRAHLGLRWFGKRDGTQVAKLVNIKRAIIHRDRLSEVPTGNLDTESK